MEKVNNEKTNEQKQNKRANTLTQNAQKGTRTVHSAGVPRRNNSTNERLVAEMACQKWVVLPSQREWARSDDEVSTAHPWSPIVRCCKHRQVSLGAIASDDVI